MKEKYCLWPSSLIEERRTSVPEVAGASPAWVEIFFYKF